MSQLSPSAHRSRLDAALSRRSVLSGATSAAILLAGAAGASRQYAEATTSLGERAAGHGLVYGAAAEWSTLAADRAFAGRFATECGILVPENDLKWERLRPAPNRYDFGRADALASFARSNGLLFRGHTLVWNHQLPVWFDEVANERNAERLLRDHIRTVVGRYAGEMHSWDVANEAVAPVDGRRDGLRNTPWLRLLGPEHIPLAFYDAAAADPNAMLVYNENAIVYDRPAHAVKREAVLRLLDSLVSTGAPVHALGIQAHLDGDLASLRPAVLERFLDDVAGLGLQVLVTELDVLDWELPADPAERDAWIADIYERFLTVALAHRAVTGVLTWGLSDRYSWLGVYAPRADGLPVRPLPLDRELRPKRAYDVIARALEWAPNRLA